MKLTAAQVAEYSAPNAFATPRTQSRGFAGGSTSDSSTKRRVATADSSESQRLLSGASDRVGKIETNLNSMLELALEGSRASTTDARRAEVFGLMRSLSAGIDEIVDQTKFKGEQVLDGRALRLSGAGASSSIRLGNLSSSGKGGLGLATRDAGAVVEVLYDDYCEWRNQNVGLVGLDITEARSADAKASASELADGRYELEVIYGGKESSVIIRELNGSERSRVDNVDLSGTGIETVRFDIGVEIDIDKKQASQSVDKYDWELLGKPSLYAKLDYTRVNTHDLTGSAEVEGPSATLSVNALGLSDAGGSFNIVDVGRGAVASGQTELESGDYRIEVHNRGEKSTAFLFDSGGRMVGSVDEVDLREEGELTLDFGNGLNVTVSQQGFSGSGTLTALASYKREPQPY